MRAFCWLLVVGLALITPRWAEAAEADLWCLTGTSSTGAPIFLPASATNPCPINVTAYASVTYAAPTTGSVSSSATIVAVPGQKVTKVCNTTASGGGNIWLNPNGGTAVSQAGDEAAAGGGCVIYGTKVLNPNGNIITGVSDSGTATYTITVGN
jgi:hypothetical protein